jgi:hypothetical protein
MLIYNQVPSAGFIPRFSNHHPLDLIESHLISSHLISSAIVILRRASGGVICPRAGLLQRAAILKIRRDAGRTEAVIADCRGDAGCLGAAAGQGMGVGLVHGGAGHRRPGTRASEGCDGFPLPPAMSGKVGLSDIKGSTHAHPVDGAPALWVAFDGKSAAWVRALIQIRHALPNPRAEPARIFNSRIRRAAETLFVGIEHRGQIAALKIGVRRIGDEAGDLLE